MTPPASAASPRRARLGGQRHAIAVAQEGLGRTAPALLVATIADPTRRVDRKLGTACASDGVDSAASVGTVLQAGETDERDADRARQPAVAEAPARLAWPGSGPHRPLRG